MKIDLNSTLFGAALSLICVAGLALGITILFRTMESFAREPGKLNRAQRVQRYLSAVALIMGQLGLDVWLLLRYSDLLKNSFSWVLGLVGGIFVFSLGLAAIRSLKK